MSEIINGSPFMKLFSDKEKDPVEDGIWKYSGTMEALGNMKPAFDTPSDNQDLIVYIFGEMIPAMTKKLLDKEAAGEMDPSLLKITLPIKMAEIEEGESGDERFDLIISLQEIFDPNDVGHDLYDTLNDHILAGLFPTVYQPLGIKDRVDLEEKYGAGDWGNNDIAVLGGVMGYLGRKMAWVVWHPIALTEYEDPTALVAPLNATLKVGTISSTIGNELPACWENRWHISMEFHPFDELAHMMNVVGVIEVIDNLVAMGAIKLPFVDNLLKKMSESGDIANKAIEKLQAMIDKEGTHAGDNSEGAILPEKEEDVTPEPEVEIVDTDSSIMDRALSLYDEIHDADS